MLSPKLEDLILKGRAFFRTAVIGGTQKATINIDDDRFIIITDMIYFPGFYAQDNTQELKPEIDFTSQFTVYGQRGFTNYIARTSYDRNVLSDRPLYSPKTQVRYDVYLLHTQQVGFSFTKGAPLIPTAFPAPANNPGYAPPLDYGREGDTGVINTSVSTVINTPTAAIYNATTRAGSGSVNFDKFQFPVDTNTAIIDNELQNTQNYPLLQVNYVEVLGLPNNLGI